MEYYRRNVLPDLVRYYRGIFVRRQIDPSSAFGDLVFAQQNLVDERHLLHRHPRQSCGRRW